MTIRPEDEEKMRKALNVPDAMTRATGSDIDPAKAARLRERAEVEEEKDRAEADNWTQGRPPSPQQG